MINIYSGIQVKCNKEDLNKKGVIYCLTFPNGKTYIGQTIQMLHRRMSDHCNKMSGCPKIKSAMQRYKTLTLSILESDMNISQLNSFEKFYIKLFNSNSEDGYNIDSGGLNKTLSDETKMKIRESHLGMKPSDETKIKLKESHRGMRGIEHSDKTKSKIGEANRGKKRTDEIKMKLSLAHKKKNKIYP